MRHTPCAPRNAESEQNAFKMSISHNKSDYSSSTQELQKKLDALVETKKSKHAAVDHEARHTQRALQEAQCHLELLKAEWCEQNAQIDKYKQVSTGLLQKTPLIRQQMNEILEIRKILTPST